jgi:hypothetical protein
VLSKVTLQIVASLIDAARGVIYDCHMFIVQATECQSLFIVMLNNVILNVVMRSVMGPLVGGGGYTT